MTSGEARSRIMALQLKVSEIRREIKELLPKALPYEASVYYDMDANGALVECRVEDWNTLAYSFDPLVYLRRVGEGTPRGAWVAASEVIAAIWKMEAGNARSK